jgi:hypothetical protein
LRGNVDCLLEMEFQVRSNLDNVAIAEQSTSGYVVALTYQFLVDERAIEASSVSNIDKWRNRRAFLENNGIEFAMAAGDEMI